MVAKNQIQWRKEELTFLAATYLAKYGSCKDM
jgi:hypothetical protein